MARKNIIKIVWNDGTSDQSFDAYFTSLEGNGPNRQINGKEILMRKDGSADLISRLPDGTPVRLMNNPTVMKVEADGKSLSPIPNVTPGEIVKYYQAVDGDEIPIMKFSKTDTMVLKAFEPEYNYTDKYVIDKHYDLEPYQGKSKTDASRNQTRYLNTKGMQKLWQYLTSNTVVGKAAEFNVSSNSSLPYSAYVRALNGHGQSSQWRLEIGRFKQPKVFNWVGEKDIAVPTAVPNTNAAQADSL